jgi:Heparinase II/III-like protein
MMTIEISRRNACKGSAATMAGTLVGFPAAAKDAPLRLILTRERLKRLKARIEGNGLARQWWGKLVKAADEIVVLEPLKYEMVGPRLLTVSRLALYRLTTLALAHAVDGKKIWLDRAVREIDAICSFPDWGPNQMLDPAEMMTALALALNWMQDALPMDRKQLIVSRIEQLGLARYAEAILADQQKKTADSEEFGVAPWVKGPSNWNLVVHGAAIIASLVIGLERPAASMAFKSAIENIRFGFASYAPDGGWFEGPGYWRYATDYAVMALDALKTGMGHDYDLSKSRGFSAAGDYRMHALGPTGLWANFGDASQRPLASAPMLWLSARFSNPVYAQHEISLPDFAWDDLPFMRKPNAFHLIWSTLLPDAPKGRLVAKPAARFKAIDQVFMRTGWNDPLAGYVAMRGGRNDVSHAHRDLGSFVYDNQGVRWVEDPGADNYDIPGYYGEARESIYRLSTKGHSIWLVDGKSQPHDASARVTGFSVTEKATNATLDLSKAYPMLAFAQREVSLESSGSLAISDGWQAADGEVIEWAIQTSCDVTIEGNDIWVTKDGRRMRMRGPEGCKWAVEEIKLSPPQRPSAGLKRLSTKISVLKGFNQFSVRFDCAQPGDAVLDS